MKESVSEWAESAPAKIKPLNDAGNMNRPKIA